MIRCKECKWWSDEIIEGYNARDCLNEKLGKDGSADSDGLFSPHEASIEGWGFGVVTNPDFGCVHGEAK
jgi:hypothetical protein